MKTLGLSVFHTFLIGVILTLSACGGGDSSSATGGSPGNIDLQGGIAGFAFDYRYYTTTDPVAAVDWSVYNAGADPASNVNVELYLTPSSAVGSAEYITFTLPALDANAATFGAEYFYLPGLTTPPTGANTARIEVDAANTIGETDEANNNATWAYTGNYPDLTVAITSITGTRTGTNNYQMTVNYTVTNNGNAEAPGYHLHFWDHLSVTPGPTTNAYVEGSGDSRVYPDYISPVDTVAGGAISPGFTYTGTQVFFTNCYGVGISKCGAATDLNNSGTAWVTVDMADSTSDPKGKVFEYATAHDAEGDNITSFTWLF